jgi:Phosphotransferase enzyme family
MKTSLLNKMVWCRPDDELANRFAHREFVNNLLSVPSRFDFITKTAAELRDGVPCTVDKSVISAGAYNIALPLVFDDGVYWLLRVTLPSQASTPDSRPDPALEPSTRLALESWVATTQYLYDHSSIMVPDVHFYDSSRTNPLGASYVVMDFIDGIPIPYSDIDEQSTEQMDKLYSQICNIVQQLSTHRFEHIGGLYEADLKYPQQVTVGPTFDLRGNPCGPFSTARDYYTTLTQRYWNEARAAPSISQLPLSETWSWDHANRSDKELFTAFLHIKALGMIDFDNYKDLNCLQHRDFKLRNILVDSDINIVGVIDWDGVSTVPMLGYDPISFCLDVEGHKDRCIQLFAKWERIDSRDSVIGDRYKSQDAVLARLLGTALVNHRKTFARELFERCYGVSWKDDEKLQRLCMQRALELVTDPSSVESILQVLLEYLESSPCTTMTILDGKC